MSTSGGSSGTSGPAGGDLAGTYPNPSVAQINTSPLGTTTGATAHQALAWSGTAWVPGSALTTGTASGDLSGTYPGPTVAQINTSPLGTTTGATTNQALAWNGSAWAPGSALTTGTASGDLSGTYPGPTVAKINGTALGTLSGAATNNVLQWNGSAWVPGAGGSGAVRVATVHIHQTNAITFTSSNASSFTELATLTNGPGTGTMDMQVNASTGDIIMLCPCFLVTAASTGNVTFDCKTVAGSNFVSGGATLGVFAWGTQSSSNTYPVAAPFFYTVVAGDISGGAVKFRPFASNSSSGTATAFTTTTAQYWFTAVNLTALATGS